MRLQSPESHTVGSEKRKAKNKQPARKTSPRAIPGDVFYLPSKRYTLPLKVGAAELGQLQALVMLQSPVDAPAVAEQQQVAALKVLNQLGV